MAAPSFSVTYLLLERLQQQLVILLLHYLTIHNVIRMQGKDLFDTLNAISCPAHSQREGHQTGVGILDGEDEACEQAIEQMNGSMTNEQ